MKYEQESKKQARVAEPVQVYLKPTDQDRLKRLTARLDTNKSDVLRRGLLALESQLTDPADHPALRLIGIGVSGEHGPLDPARDHDTMLADSEVESWKGEGGGGDGS